MSLKFLAKKSWHTTNIKNVEKVWIAEETAAKEQKKLAELQKQIQEERQIQELRELQVASGQVVRNTDTTMDWMYEGPAAQQQQFGEDYLLGKIYKAEDNRGSSVAGVDLRREKDPGALWLSKVNTKNDSFTRLHEDPLLAIRKQEKTVREDIVHNPVKMARIKHRIAEDLAKLGAKKERKEKKSRKDKKGHREHKKEIKKRDRSRSSSRGRMRRRRGTSSDESSRSRSRDRNRGDGMLRSDRKRSRSNSSDRPRHRRDMRFSERSRERYLNRQNSGDRSTSPRSGEKRRRDESPKDDRPRHSVGKSYGLVKHGGSNASSNGNPKESLGPDIQLLKKKEAEDAEKNEWRKRLNRDGVKKLTQEEKDRRLAQMEQDALISEARRKKTIEIKKNPVEDREAVGSNSVSADFIKSMRSEVYNNQDLDASSAMEERMRRNRHYQQSSSDFDKGFMKI